VGGYRCATMLPAELVQLQQGSSIEHMPCPVWGAGVSFEASVTWVHNGSIQNAAA
jgi:hypothetical protein